MANKSQSKNQAIFKDMFVGTLLYAVVMGFYCDYTDILNTSSFSVLFLASFVMQVLTFATFWVKGRVSSWFKAREGKKYKVGRIIGMWLVLFLSKFVFLEVIDVIFGDSVSVSGFVGLMGIILTMTIIDRLSAYVYSRLG